MGSAALPAVDAGAVPLLIDLGSGGGSPAIPLKIARPEFALAMVESKGRKSAFLRDVIRQLSLSRAEVVTDRFENLVAEGAKPPSAGSRQAEADGPVENRPVPLCAKPLELYLKLRAEGPGLSLDRGLPEGWVAVREYDDRAHPARLGRARPLQPATHGRRQAP